METEKAANGMERIPIAATLAAGTNRQIIATARGHKIRMDVRKEWGGDNAGPTPPECLAIGLGGCVMNIVRIIAQERHISLENLEITVSGNIDPSRAFGLDSRNRAGFDQITVQVAFAPELTADEKEEFYQDLLRRCPLCDTISNPTPLRVSM